MILGVLKRYATEARRLIREEGLTSSVRKSAIYFSRVLYQHQEFYIWQNEIGDMNGPFAPKVDDFDFMVISAPEGLDELLREGFSIGSPFSIDDSRRMLVEHQVGFLLFIHKELACCCWAAMDEKASTARRPRNIDYTKEAYLWYSLTSPQYRGLGLITHVTFRCLQYLKEKGKSNALLLTRKDNKHMIESQKKLGSHVCGEMKYRRLLLRHFWRERWYSAK